MVVVVVMSTTARVGGLGVGKTRHNGVTHSHLPCVLAHAVTIFPPFFVEMALTKGVGGGVTASTSVFRVVPPLLLLLLLLLLSLFYPFG